jgi:O-antigen ligase
VSCVLLLVMSWIVVFDPRLALTAAPLKDYYCVAAYGVPVKNYIDQSQEFALRAVALAYPIASLLRAKRVLPAAFVGAFFPSFVIDVS